MGGVRYMVIASDDPGEWIGMWTFMQQGLLIHRARAL